MTRNFFRILLCGLIGSATTLSGCALIRNDSAAHSQLQPTQIKLADDIHLASQGWPQAQWWRQLNDPQLSSLIDQSAVRFPYPCRSKQREEKAQSQPICWKQDRSSRWRRSE
ncbi:Multidrug resistance outer membrane protein MdtP precursor [Kluyvera cryocrescens]|uniref:Multidrug resistance outer membrane protein MdtP n=1 Tax=Kluyvera cryocrescens TaxID=580 RepID=A0A485A9H0_KLUCR|nr:Multidrug resistance outer membrane protein MdtP precursor [Kluyvera cryocrescens]